MVWKAGSHYRPFFPFLADLFLLWSTMAGYKRSLHQNVDLPCLRNRPWPGYQCSEEYFKRRTTNTGVVCLYGRAGHARTERSGTLYKTLQMQGCEGRTENPLPLGMGVSMLRSETNKKIYGFRVLTENLHQMLYSYRASGKKRRKRNETTATK